LHISYLRDFDLGSGQTAYHRVSLNDLYIHWNNKFRSNHNFLLMDVWIGRVDIH